MPRPPMIPTSPTALFGPQGPPGPPGPPGPSGGGQGFRPEDYGDGAPGYPNNDGPAIQAAIDDAAINGGLVELQNGKTYGWSGDITQKTGVDVRGVSTSGFGTAPAGLKAINGTARYQYGNFSGNPYPGTLSNVLIDGDGVGGATELLRIEAVDSAIRDVAVVRGAGHGIVYAGAQNVVVDHAIVDDFPDGTAVLFRNRDGQAANTQGAGGCKFLNSHVTKANKLIGQDYVTNEPLDPLQFWPHDNFVVSCLFEQYQDTYHSLAHIEDGEIRFLLTAFTGSSGEGPATADCIMLIENEIRDTNSTIVSMTDCYMGGGAAAPTDAIRMNSFGLANIIAIGGARFITANTTYVLCDDKAGGGAGAVGSIDCRWDGTSGQIVSRGINGGDAAAFLHERVQPLRITTDADDGNPFQIRKLGETKNRLQITETGTIQALDGASSTIRASMLRSGSGWAINGSNVIEIIAYTTVLRPAASGLTNRIILDVTLGILLWSDGTNWRKTSDGTVA